MNGISEPYDFIITLYGQPSLLYSIVTELFPHQTIPLCWTIPYHSTILFWSCGRSYSIVFTINAVYTTSYNYIALYGLLVTKWKYAFSMIS